MSVSLVCSVDQTWNGGQAGHEEVVSLTARVDDAGLALSISAPFHGDPRPSGPPGRRDRLWEFEVVEFFLVGPADRYVELEFGPGGHWLALGLDGVRNVVDPAIEIRYRATLDGDRWSGEAELDAAHLPERPWRWNAFAIHGMGERRRYLAAHPVPGPHPDFHRPERFPEIESTI